MLLLHKPRIVCILYSWQSESFLSRESQIPRPTFLFFKDSHTDLESETLFSYLGYSNVSQRKADNKANQEAPHDEQTNNRVSFIFFHFSFPSSKTGIDSLCSVCAMKTASRIYCKDLLSWIRYLLPRLFSFALDIRKKLCSCKYCSSRPLFCCTISRKYVQTT